MGGSTLVFTALTIIALVMLRAWIYNTNRERDELTASRRQADEQERKYFALQAAIEQEATRMRRDLNTERYNIARTLIEEREKMAADFEERRLGEAQKAFREGVQMERAGHLRPDKPIAALLQFPG